MRWEGLCVWGRTVVLCCLYRYHHHHARRRPALVFHALGARAGPWWQGEGCDRSAALLLLLLLAAKTGGHRCKWFLALPPSHLATRHPATPLPPRLISPSCCLGGTPPCLPPPPPMSLGADSGFLTILLQCEAVPGLEAFHGGEWHLVQVGRGRGISWGGDAVGQVVEGGHRDWVSP